MIITSQQFKETYKKLPYILREYIADDELATISESIGQQYGMHVDTIGALYREATNMLLGLENPEQFMGELKSVGVPAEQVGPIVDQLNQKVFIPLREKMQNEGDHDPYKENEELYQELDNATPAPVGTTHTPVAPVPSVPAFTPIVPEISASIHAAVSNPTFASAPSYAQTPIAPAPSISQFNSQPISQPTYAPQYVAPQPLPQAPVQAQPTPLPQYVPAPQPVWQQPVQQPAPRPQPLPPANLPGTEPTATVFSPIVPSTPVPVAHPEMRTMAHDMDLVKEGTYEPPPAPASAPQATVPTPTPIREPVPTAPAASRPVAPTTSAAPRTRSQEELHQVLKQYGIDPYREPVE